jgi:hypothetical protein
MDPPMDPMSMEVATIRARSKFPPILTKLCDGARRELTARRGIC